MKPVREKVWDQAQDRASDGIGEAASGALWDRVWFRLVVNPTNRVGNLLSRQFTRKSQHDKSTRDNRHHLQRQWS